MRNGKFCPKCICFACNKVVSECLEWQSHCHASTTNVTWRETRKKLTGDVYTPPNAAAPVVKEKPVKPVKPVKPPKPVKEKKEKKVKVVVPLTESMSWFGDVYPPETFKHLISTPLGKALYKHLLGTVKPLETAKGSMTAEEITVEMGQQGIIMNLCFNKYSCFL